MFTWIPPSYIIPPSAVPLVSIITDLKAVLHTKFNIKDLGEAKYYLGLEVSRTEQVIALSQKKFILDMLQSVNLLDAKPLSIPLDQNLKLYADDRDGCMDSHKYKSIEHRVATNGSNNRVSMPIFVNPRLKDITGPLPEVLRNGEKPIYKKILYSDYVKHFLCKGHVRKKTVNFTKI
ncbi:hypothetical protein AgCh_030641 [Apium graveolens]